MITEKGETTTSYLLIQDARISDSGKYFTIYLTSYILFFKTLFHNIPHCLSHIAGKYSCSPSNADVATVRVHVLANGKSPTCTIIFM